jgi:glycosyltransferase involved in cell wall biosynthesis
MEAQALRRDEVTYFFRGRHYPLAPSDRLHRWERRGVAMREVLNSTLNFGGDSGTLTPEADLTHPASEAVFLKVLEERRPELIHVQELIGLPSSLIEIGIAHGIPVVATLHDYFPLCPVIKLYDIDGRLCHRHDVGAQCARCSTFAPAGRSAFAIKTMAYELRRGMGPKRGGQAVRAGQRLLARSSPRPSPGDTPSRTAEPLRYQARRDINVGRLNRLDALVAPSRRVREIYAELGVDDTRLRVVHLTLRHLQDLRPQRLTAVPGPVRFVSLNGIGSQEKGAEVIGHAIEALHHDGLTGRFTLDLHGYTSDAGRSRVHGLPGVHVHGSYTPAQIDRLLDGYHVGIVPSVWEEPYGLVGLELLAKGIPVIGNARGGIVDYTEDGTTGWINRAADATGLAEIMRSIIADPGQVVERNRWIREHRTQLIKPLELHLAELDELYAEVIDGAGHRRSALKRLTGG